MKKLVLGLLCTVSLTIFTYAAPEETVKPAPRPEKATLGVLPFIIDESIRISFGNETLIPRVVETEFTSELMQFLVKSRKFNVLERDYLRKIMNENKITESDYAKPGEASRIGKLLVADYLVIGHIDRLTFLIKPKIIELTGERKLEITATFKISFRITEVKTGKIVFAQSLTRKLTSKEVREKIPYEERKDWTLVDYKEYLFRKVSVQAGNLILEGIYPIKIASVQEGQVVLNRGQGAGIKKGNVYEVFQLGESVVDPDTGDSLGNQEIKVGTIEVISVEPKFSKAKILTQLQPLTLGSICRSVIKEKTEEAPAYPRQTPGW
jgi:curli biogenesis system outer membrane secretion channel CsgG